MNRKTGFNLGYLIVAMFGVVLLHGLWEQSRAVAPLAFSEFQAQLEKGNVAEVVITKDRMLGEFKEADAEGRKRFVTTRVELDLAGKLQEHQVKFSGQVTSNFLTTLLSWVVPVLLFFVVWMFLIRRVAGRLGGSGAMSIGKSKAKVYVEADVGTRFHDVAGVDEAIEELRELVDFLRDRESYGRLGARMPKGVLLVGPPGTGKTLLARAVAGEAGVTFFSLSGSDFVEMFVGVGAARVRDLFEQARQKAPCIIFIDELDALGRARSIGGMAGGNDEKEQTLNQLLVELDGFDARSGIMILAATNRPEILDPALLRAGRFDRQVLVDRPDKKGRADILRVHLRKVSVAEEVPVDEIAALTPGFTGADLANLINEAALLATRRGADKVTMADFTAAIERIVAGLEKKNRLLNPREREVVAYHEMGHALVAAALPGSDPVHKVSIIPRGIGALGYTIQRPTEDRFLMTRDELESKLCVLLGGRAAEHIVFGHLSTGAADDLARSTNIARSMVTRYGMSEKLGHVAYEEERSTFLGQAGYGGSRRDYSEETAREIDCAVRATVQRAFDRARRILEANRSLLVDTATMLLVRETLDEAALQPAFARLQAPPAAAPDAAAPADGCA